LKVWYNINVIKRDYKTKKNKFYEKEVFFMAEKKITKRENFGAIVEILRAGGHEDYAKIMEHEIALLNRKRSGNGNLTPKQKENEEIKNKIMEVVTATGGAMTVTQMMATEELGDYTMNKLVALVSQLRRENRLIRYYEKSIAHFRLPEFEGEVNEEKE
jgi:uncharacterized protein YqeY